MCCFAVYQFESILCFIDGKMQSVVAVKCLELDQTKVHCSNRIICKFDTLKKKY